MYLGNGIAYGFLFMFYYYTCIAIYNARKFSDDRPTVSEALAVSRWAALIEC